MGTEKRPTNRATTEFSQYSRRRAALVLTITSLAIVWCLEVSLRAEAPATPPSQGGQDLTLYRRIIDRVHAGENYYDAAGTELRTLGYPTGSVFNWRTPLYAWVIGNLPDPAWAQIILGFLVLTTLLLAFAVIQDQAGVGRAMAGVLLLLGAFEWSIDGDAYLSQELWAGTLIVLSICASAQDRWLVAVAAGLLALFIRELALPYCGLALVLSLRRHRLAETAAWTTGLALYAIFLCYHGFEVSRRLTPDDRLPGSWIQFGGTAFLLATCRMNAFLFALPKWVSAIYLPLSLLGLASWTGPHSQHVKLTVGLYLAAFAIVGQPFNNYWGLLYVPLLPFGLVWAPQALRDLTIAVRGLKTQNEE